MSRALAGGRLVVASHNAGKVREIAELLGPYGVEIVSAAELDLPVPEETEETFEGNARIKAHAAARASGLPALSDDSGLAVDALDGAPGVHSADWAETDSGRDFPRAMELVRERVAESGAEPPISARFVSCLCLAWPDGHDEIFLGTAEGRLEWPPRGERGFGYDPIFIPSSNDRSFGEMAPEEKQAISHRAAAFRQMVAACFEPCARA